MSDPFNLPKPQQQGDLKKKNTPLAKVDKDLSAEIVNSLPDATQSSLTPEQRMSLADYAKTMKFGISGVAAMICKDDKCPYYNKCPLVRANIPRPLNKDCQTPDTMVYTANRGQVKIKDLDQVSDRVISVHMRHNVIRTKGRRFTLHSRDYSGDIVRISAGGHTHECTKGHISLVRWNEKSIDLFAIYLMRKGSKFRIGKTKLFLGLNKIRYSGIIHRARAEEADDMWILGVYKTNTEALLAEEYFSVTAQIPKALFLATNTKKNIKYDGLYKWVTQDQLDAHHESMCKNIAHYSAFLDSLGLSIDYPVWSVNDPHRADIGSQRTIRIRACNIIGEYMDAPVAEDISHKSGVVFNEISIDRVQYNGKVYSLGVDVDETYIANNIATHNCPVEEGMQAIWLEQFAKALEIDTEDINSSVYDMLLLNDLASYQLLESRATMELAENPKIQVKSVAGIDPKTGQAFYKVELNQVILFKEKISKMKNKLLRELIATRKAKSEESKGTYTDRSQQAAELIRRAEEIRKKKVIDIPSKKSE